MGQKFKGEKLPNGKIVLTPESGCLGTLYDMIIMGVGLCTMIMAGCSHACSRDTSDKDEDTPENNTEVIYSKPESQGNPFVSPEEVEQNRRDVEMYSNKKYKHQ